MLMSIPFEDTDIAFDTHVSDGLGAESNMHVEFVIGFSTRWILRTRPIAFFRQG
jgi:hypothetical protein